MTITTDKLVSNHHQEKHLPDHFKVTMTFVLTNNAKSLAPLPSPIFPTKASNQNHLPTLLIWKINPPLSWGICCFWDSTWTNCSSLIQSEKTQTEPRCWGTRGLEENTSSVWVPRGQGYRSCLSKPASTREPGNRDHEENLRVFSLRQQWTIYLLIQARGEKGTG